MMNNFPIKKLCFLIGAMKAGSSTLFDLLSSSQDICTSEPKEPMYLAKTPLCEFTPMRFFENFRPSGYEKVALEGTTDNSKYPYVVDVPKKLKILENFGYEIKIIYIIRHPIERIESHLRHLALHHSDVLERKLNICGLECGLSDKFVTFSSYAYQLDQFTKMFPRSSIYVVLLEDLKVNPQVVINNIADSLQLNRWLLSNSSLELRANESEKIKEWHSLPKSYLFFSELAIAKKLLAPLLPKNFKRWTRFTLSQQYPIRTKLTPDEINIVVERLKPDMLRLRDEWGLDIERAWHFPHVYN